MDTQIDLSELNLSEKEQKILEAAISIFNDKGYSGTTTSEIAKKAGVAEGTIFRYFKTKKDILSSILVTSINLISSKVALSGIEDLAQKAENHDMRWFLKELIKDRLSFVKSLFPMLRVVLIEASYHKEIRDALFENIAVPANKLFTNLYGSMIEKNTLRNDIPPEIIMRSVVANIAALVFQSTFFPEYLSNEGLEKHIDATIDIIISGIEKRGV